MPIIRTVKDKDHPYVVINRSFANDDRLSWEARGVLVYLLTKPDHWEIQPDDLITQSPNAKKDKVYRILKELELCGYIERIRTQEPDGTFVWSQNVYEIPRDGDLTTPRKQRQKKSGNPFTGNPEMEPFTENQEMAKADKDRPFPGLPFPVQPFPVNPEILVSNDQENNNNNNMRGDLQNTVVPSPENQRSLSPSVASLEETKRTDTQTKEQASANSKSDGSPTPLPRHPSPQDMTYKQIWEACTADGRDWLERLAKYAPERRRLLQLVEVHGLAFVAAGVEASAAQSGRAIAYLVTMCERCQANGTTPGAPRSSPAAPAKVAPPSGETEEEKIARWRREYAAKGHPSTYHGGTHGPRTA